MEFLMELYCTYCGMAQGDRIQCCSENHWMTNEEYREYHGEAPDDGSEEAAYYEELNKGYAKDRI
jgi:hypothetical protein